MCTIALDSAKATPRWRTGNMHYSLVGSCVCDVLSI